MSQFALALLACAGIAAVAGQVDTGVEMSTKALRGACWYECLYKMPSYDKPPKRNGCDFQNCFLNLDMGMLQQQFADQGVTGDDAIPYLGQYTADPVHQYLPREYFSCDDYLNDANKVYSSDFSQMIGDGGGDYPFKGYTYCILGTIKNKYGKEATSALEDHWKGKTPFRQVFLERENKFRERHGAPPMQLDEELNTRAQRWADKLAERCPDKIQLTDHITRHNPDYLYKGEATGENLFQAAADSKNYDDISLSSSGSWYSEVKNYPWPAFSGMQNKPDWPMFEKIGHFTQQVWKRTNSSGYGIGMRDGCNSVYVVGRYWPAGNLEDSPGAFASNVGAYTGKGK